MQTQVSLLDAAGTWRQDVLVEADPESPADDVAGALGALRRGRLFLDGRPFGKQGRVADSGLRDGAVLRLLPDGATPSEPMPGVPAQAGWEVAVVSGPGAGVRTLLTAPEALIGRDPTTTVRVDHHSVSRVHARLSWRPHPERGPGWVIEDLGSANGTWIDGRRIDGPTPLEPGAAVEVGASVLEVRATPPADADVHVDEDGSLAFNRPPRLQPAARQPSVEVPSKPAQPEAMPFPWIQALVPLALGGVLYATTHALATLAFIAMSPILVVSSTIGQRRRHATHAKDEAQ
ncbi:MAG: FHA domain-containing protein, partial [Acidimicrobiaceae bacterium]|nr:FHA domain-containing protein [Acidimicrobiaceae bacterium]